MSIWGLVLVRFERGFWGGSFNGGWGIRGWRKKLRVFFLWFGGGGGGGGGGGLLRFDIDFERRLL
jgi:hypothetical protein